MKEINFMGWFLKMIGTGPKYMTGIQTRHHHHVDDLQHNTLNHDYEPKTLQLVSVTYFFQYN